MTNSRALIVDDDRSWQLILKEILEDAGFEVDLASDLSSAVHLVSEHAHRIGVIDLSLDSSDHHNQDGLTVLKSIRQRDPTCATLLLSGFATVEIAVGAVTAYGALTCLRKEKFNRSEFRDLIDRILSNPPSEKVESDLIDGVQEVDSFISAEGIDRKSRVLVVEDDAGWRDVLAELLTDAECQTEVCRSYGEALGYLRRNKYDALIVDLSLNIHLTPSNDDSPHLIEDYEGYRLLSNISHTGIPVIVVSGVAGVDVIDQVYKELQVYAFLEKQTFDRSEFIKTVQEAVKTQYDATGLHQLTHREIDVLNLLAQGMTNKEIASTLVISSNTVKRHLKAIFEKLDIHTRSAAASLAANWFNTTIGDG